MSYKNLEIWQEARELVKVIHTLSLNLPKFELYEERSQIRKSSKSVKSNIVEGYGRKRHQMDYIRFLTCALASNDETIDHLETLFETGSYTNESEYKIIHDKLIILGKKINKFIPAVERG